MNSQDTQHPSTAGQVHTSDLECFVAEVDKLGGPSSPHAAGYISDFSLKFDTKIDETLDPFSEEYFEQQIKLYKEISSRDLNQEEGEQFVFDVDAHVKKTNPRGTQDINFMSKHVRTITTALYMANLPPDSRILDMGSGWGLSSEIFAFCAANVTCVDINPLFIDLNKKRANRLNLPMEARLSEFDSYQDDKSYDLVFFYECLHHSLKPWVTLENLAKFLKTDGKVVFAAEPINSIYWKNWGLRLDPLSIYCIHKYGWFESGWSESFLTQAFKHAGLNLHVYPHVGIDNGTVGLAIKASNPMAPEVAFNLNPTALSQTYNELGQQHRTLAEQHHTLNQAHHGLVEQHHALSQAHHRLVEQHHALSQAHHGLVEQHNALVNSRLVRLKRKIWSLLGLSKS